MMEAIVTGIVLIGCLFGVAWFIYDYNKTIQAMIDAQNESCPGQVNEEDE